MKRGTWTASAVTVALAAACACHPHGKTGEGGSGPSGGTAAAASCDSVTAPVTALYQAEAKATGAEAHDATFVADNVAMVQTDCARDPGRVAACAAGATSVAQLEKDCLIPLDEEGTDGEAIR
jgi:hypothetical protein